MTHGLCDTKALRQQHSRRAWSCVYLGETIPSLDPKYLSQFGIQLTPSKLGSFVKRSLQSLQSGGQ